MQRRLAAMTVGVMGVGGLAAVGMPGAVETSLAAPPQPIVCKLPTGTKSLPPGARRGLIKHLQQYPDISLASPRQRARAAHILEQLVATARDENWPSVDGVARAGYKTHTAVRKPGDRSIHYFHAEYENERGGRFALDPRRPKALIFANAPGRPLVLVGAMWSMRREERGPTPAGPILRWHSHLVCVRGNQRGTKPLEGGNCRPGAQLRQGTEMLHVWFTRDLRSAFSTRAPEPELCAAGLLPASYCQRYKERRREQRLEGKAPTRAALVPAVEAAFTRESYAPGATATLVVSNRAQGLRLRIFHSGPERISTNDTVSMNGIPVTRTRSVGSSAGRRAIQIRIGPWQSGLYFGRLRAADGRVGFAPFVVRPRRIGEHRVAVVLPTLTWQAYNLRDDDRDGRGDSWYAQWRHKTVRLGRPFLNRGVPYHFRRYDLPFLNWLSWTHHDVDYLAQADVEAAESSAALAKAYDLIVFPGHHEYVTTREYNLVEGYRNLGGNLMFLSANDFFWRVVRQGNVIRKTKLWRDLGRPEAALIGVQYLANGKAPRRPWIVRRTDAAWIFEGTGLGPGSAFGRGGVEIDRTSRASPRGVRVLAEIRDLLGPGKTAQMTFYETPKGAKVFAAGAFYFTRWIHMDPMTSRLVDNIWTRLARD
jgi:N,N-dimethylformamidase beta subunit-like, C-terminal